MLSKYAVSEYKISRFIQKKKRSINKKIKWNKKIETKGIRLLKNLKTKIPLSKITLLENILFRKMKTYLWELRSRCRKLEF